MADRIRRQPPGVAAPFAASSATQHLELDAYNFSDRTLALYDIDIDYRDSADAHVDAQHAKYGHASFTGHGYVCKPRQWCHFAVDLERVPTAAARARITLTRAKDSNNQLVYPRG